MKFTVTFKDPDALVKFGTRKHLFDILNKYVKYGEYVTIEFDTEAKTATVIECGK